ncbi:MAG: hypothetical protein ACLT3D_11625 [Lawsonibacter sp.]
MPPCSTGASPTGRWRRRSGWGRRSAPCRWGSLVPFCPVRAGADLRWPLREGERLELRPDLPLEQLTAPVQEGVRIGTLRGAVGDEAAGEVPLVCGASVPRDLAEPRRGLLRRLLSWLEER